MGDTDSNENFRRHPRRPQNNGNNWQRDSYGESNRGGQYRDRGNNSRSRGRGRGRGRSNFHRGPQHNNTHWDQFNNVPANQYDTNYSYETETPYDYAQAPPFVPNHYEHNLTGENTTFETGSSYHHHGNPSRDRHYNNKKAPRGNYSEDNRNHRKYPNKSYNDRSSRNVETEFCGLIIAENGDGNNPNDEFVDQKPTEQKKSYSPSKTRNNNPVDVSRREALITQLQRNSYECMICCEKIRRQHKIWSCIKCFHIFHLSCIQKWASSSADGT